MTHILSDASFDFFNISRAKKWINKLVTINWYFIYQIFFFQNAQTIEQIDRHTHNVRNKKDHKLQTVTQSKLRLVMTYSVIRTEKLVLPATMSYQAISCRIKDSKYLVRIRVTCRIAVRLKQSTQNIPNRNCHAADINESMKYAMESSIIASKVVSGVGLVLIGDKNSSL